MPCSRTARRGESRSLLFPSQLSLYGVGESADTVFPRSLATFFARWKTASGMTGVGSCLRSSIAVVATAYALRQHIQCMLMRIRRQASASWVLDCVNQVARGSARGASSPVPLGARRPASYWKGMNCMVPSTISATDLGFPEPALRLDDPPQAVLVGCVYP